MSDIAIIAAVVGNSLAASYSQDMAGYTAWEFTLRVASTLAEDVLRDAAVQVLVYRSLSADSLATLAASHAPSTQTAYLRLEGKQLAQFTADTCMVGPRYFTFVVVAPAALLTSATTYTLTVHAV